jgi:ATP-dependent Clp protease adaptor protein ClpS
LANKVEYELDINLDLEEPKKYKVLLLNDNFSTMEFVIDILIKVFRQTESNAKEIMLKVHNEGRAVCGIYTYEISNTKIAQVKYSAKKAGFPLKAILEEE